MEPSIGRIVHFYTTDATKHSNGQGNGPYPAIITQIFAGGAQGCNLKVFPPFGAPYDEGSCPQIAVQAESDPNQQSRWWTWPPRV